MSASKKRGLGRGLATLLSDITPKQNEAQAITAETVVMQNSVGLQTLPVDMLQRGKYQPRKNMDQQALQELADSIKASGIIQPIVVRKVGNENYEIIAGERRWRAAQLAGLHEVPVVVRDIDDHQASALALIENIQREDLNALEEALALQRLIHEFTLTHEEVANLVGKSRATITNLLRVLNLNNDVQKLLELNQIELGHAKALLSLTGSQQSQVAQIVVARGFSVRETEHYVRNLLQGVATPEKKTKTLSADVLHVQERLSEVLGAKVNLSYNAKGKGKIQIQYNNLDELQGILEHFKV